MVELFARQRALAMPLGRLPFPTALGSLTAAVRSKEVKQGEVGNKSQGGLLNT